MSEMGSQRNGSCCSDADLAHGFNRGKGRGWISVIDGNHLDVIAIKEIFV